MINNDSITSLPPTSQRVSITKTASGKDSFDFTVEAYGVSPEELVRMSYALRSAIVKQFPHLEGI